MKLFTSLVALLSLASLVVPSYTADQRLSSCKASDRVLVSTRNVTAAGHDFQVSTKACSADVLNSRAIEKRQVFDVCNNGERVAGGAGPTFTDCDNLSAAMAAAFEQPGDPTLFVVDPQFAQEFTLGTCLWAFINDNPVGGAILEFCYVEVAIAQKIRQIVAAANEERVSAHTAQTLHPELVAVGQSPCHPVFTRPSDFLAAIFWR
ncbi:hypothetical protein B0H11DRAFT_2292079 [Mycena galericulata]|nr:hypothetical protein B0H11DRAFT_2292079 [Mycena galericulata]